MTRLLDLHLEELRLLNGTVDPARLLSYQLLQILILREHVLVLFGVARSLLQIVLESLLKRPVVLVDFLRQLAAHLIVVLDILVLRLDHAAVEVTLHLIELSIFFIAHRLDHVE